ncbi:hypothetical protein ACHAWF_001453 [Thalassiosira exigua]
MEWHFVPHAGYEDEMTAEPDVLDRWIEEVEKEERVTFGDKTAMVPGGPDVDVLIYNVGIHHRTTRARKTLRRFVERVSRPLMRPDQKSTDESFARPDENAGGNATTDGRPRPRIVYVLTPAQHYAAPLGQWHANMRKEEMSCVPKVDSNPRADLERQVLLPGVNVDAVVEYDDLELGSMHVRHGHDCSHYCMPGPPDVVARRLLTEVMA